MESAAKRQDILADSVSAAVDLMYILARDGPGELPLEVYRMRVRDTGLAMFHALGELDAKSPRIWALLSSLLKTGLLRPKTAVTLARECLKKNDVTFSLLSLTHQASVTGR